MTPRLGRAWLVTAALVVAGCGAAAPIGADPDGFEDARSLAAEPDGTLWVVDADGVVSLRGPLAVRVGGVGTGAEAFLDPVDVDPTNGQAVYVADRAAGAVLQFTEEARLAVTFPIFDVDPTQPLRQTRTGADRMRARPVAVAAGTDGILYVADAGRRHVLRLDAEGAVERVLGAGVLVDAVDLAVSDDGMLWVADAGRGVLLSFDPFGAAGPTIEVPASVGRLASVAASGEGVVVAGARGVALVRDGMAEVLPLDIVPEPLRGAVLVGRSVIGLSPTQIVRLGDVERD